MPPTLTILPLGCHRFALLASLGAGREAMLLTGDLETCRLALAHLTPPRDVSGLPRADSTCTRQSGNATPGSYHH